MQSVAVDVFFSTSFAAGDEDVNALLKAIVDGLDLKGVNVSYGASRLPLDQARKMIRGALGLIAVCPKREALADGTFNMPQAVNDEIAIAVGEDRPILAIVEKGVNLGGFKEKFRTWHEFERGSLNDPDFLKRTIKALHEFKVELIDGHMLSHGHEPADSHAERLDHLVELKWVGGDFAWEYSTTKKIIYTRDSTIAFPTSVFATQGVKVPPDSPPITWGYEQLDSSRSLKLVPTIEQQTASCVEVRLRPDPPAETGDHITYRTFSRSRHLIPLWEDEAADDRRVHLSSGDFGISEGLLFIHRTKRAVIEFRICREYGLRLRDLVPFVASYTSSIDFEVESELRRANLRVDDFGGSLTVRMEIESALPGHIYGIAWNPPPKPTAAAPATA